VNYVSALEEDLPATPPALQHEAFIISINHQLIHRKKKVPSFRIPENTQVMPVLVVPGTTPCSYSDSESPSCLLPSAIILVANDELMNPSTILHISRIGEICFIIAVIIFFVQIIRIFSVFSLKDLEL